LGGTTWTNGGSANTGGTKSSNTLVENCPETQRQQVSQAISQLLQKAEYSGCTESGIARSASTQCKSNSNLAQALLKLGYCLGLPLRSDVDEAALLAEAQRVAGGLYCPKFGCASGPPIYRCLRNSLASVSWCISGATSAGSCGMQSVCQCANGEFLPQANECDGNPDCSDGSDEQGCCAGIAGFVRSGQCSSTGDTCLNRTSTNGRERCTCGASGWTCTP